jgi:hypothetical protein
MRFRNSHRFPGLDRELLRTADPNPTGDLDGGGASPADSDANTTDGPVDSGDSSDSNLEGLKKALQAERALKRQLEAQLKQVGQANPDLLREAQAKAEAAEQQRKLIEQQAALDRQELDRKYQKQLERVTGDLQAAKIKAEREALRIKVEREFLTAKGLAEASEVDGRSPFDYIWELYGNQFADDNGGIRLVETDGSPHLDRETGKPVTPAEFFAKLRKDRVHGVHFKPEFGTGSGSRSAGDGRPPNGRSLDSMSSKDLISEGIKAARDRR